MTLRSRFNSRAHGGRDRIEATKERTVLVSIHGGRDQVRQPARHQRVVSIHAPTGGATSRKSRPPKCNRFNSRAHGGRDWNPRVKSRVTDVSIHAPTGGATKEVVAIATTAMFQFTRPRGARPAAVRRVSGTSGFNSRAHGGRDRDICAKCGTKTVSIHAPTGGATGTR